MKRRWIFGALLFVFVVTAACSSESEPGEVCDVPGGTTDVCVPGTVCGRPTNGPGPLVCLFICDKDKDCPKDYACRPVERTHLKGCRAK